MNNPYNPANCLTGNNWQQKQNRLKNLATGALALGTLVVAGITHAMPSVTGTTISWPDDGWYQVQLANDFASDICQGGLSCEVAPGTYVVINHTTGERWENIVASASSESASDDESTESSSTPMVAGNTISWADNGWYQVQIAGDFTSDICQGGTSCEVEPGTYVVINLTTGERFNDIVVTGDSSGSLPNIVDTAVAAGSFNTLVAALQATGLDAALADETTTFTVFAPTDDAFALLGDDLINALLADTDTLTDILLYHAIVGAAVDAATAISLDGMTANTANGDAIALNVIDGALFINESQVIVADIQTSNGIIHVIDAVLIPPTDEATPAEETPSSEPQGTILEVAEAAGSFGTLLAALEASGLDAALGHPADNYTVFAPTDDAFAALGEETINALLADPDTLRDILLFHVIPGTVFQAADFLEILGFDIGAGNAGTLNVNAEGEGLAVNGVSIVVADIPASNGVIHVIDAVLLP